MSKGLCCKHRRATVYFVGSVGDEDDGRLEVDDFGEDEVAEDEVGECDGDGPLEGEEVDVGEVLE